MSTKDPADVRREYKHSALRRKDLAADPMAQFSLWLDAALAADLKDATAMALATADADGWPSCRVVLLKGHDEHGLVFYSDYRSRKARDLAANARAELLFHWREFDRQIRIQGTVARTERALSEDYFHSRPRDSQISAAASVQSAPVEGRAEMEQAVSDLKVKHAEGEVPVPVEWGGYRLQPQRFEFWQGRENRLHDRFVYTRVGEGWGITRLQP